MKHLASFSLLPPYGRAERQGRPKSGKTANETKKFMIFVWSNSRRQTTKQKHLNQKRKKSPGTTRARRRGAARPPVSVGGGRPPLPLLKRVLRVFRARGGRVIVSQDCNFLKTIFVFKFSDFLINPIMSSILISGSAILDWRLGFALAEMNFSGNIHISFENWSFLKGRPPILGSTSLLGFS